MSGRTLYMQQRYYDPIAGRFLSVDPVTTDVTTGELFNRYNYANNNPYKYTDPDGSCSASRIDVAPGSICGGSGSAAIAAATAHVAQAAQAQLNSAARGAGNLWNIIVAAVSGEGAETPTVKDPPVPGATPGRETKGRTTQWDKGGGMDEANRDFDAKGPKDVVPLPDGGRRGTLPDGRQINVRPDSSGKVPTLEIQDGKNRDKVRYGP
jgi:RHS repeat-associated protein